jgi:hypothetical protein
MNVPTGTFISVFPQEHSAQVFPSEHYANVFPQEHSSQCSRRNIPIRSSLSSRGADTPPIKPNPLSGAPCIPPGLHTESFLVRFRAQFPREHSYQILTLAGNGHRRLAMRVSTNVPAGTFVPLREQKRVLHTNSLHPQRFHLAFEN